MKKTAILLILVMMISLLPALSVSAADEYTLEGLYQGEKVIAQRESTKTVTLVKASTASADIAKVSFTFNDNSPVTIYGSDLSYTMTFTELGTQTLKYDVYKTGNSSDTPDESKTITFNVVAGTLNAASVATVDFENTTVDKIKSLIIANNGANISDRLSLSLEQRDGSTALKITGDGANKSAYMQLRGASSETGHKLHYYSFDMAMSTAYSVNLSVSDGGYAKTGTILFTNKNTSNGIGTHSSIGSTKTAHIDLILDYNDSPKATIYKNGALWQTISLNFGADGEDPVVTLYVQTHSSVTPVYIDNFSYSVYDTVPTPTFTAASIAGGDKPVLETLSQVRFTGSSTYLDGQDAADFVTLTERANSSADDFAAASIGYTAYIDGTEIVVDFDEELAPATTYKINISGIKDEYLMPYADYSFTFRTLNEGENPLPEVSLLSPETGTRFYPNESTVTLSAEANDTLGGTISYVEFYADGVLIEGSRITAGVDDVYTYEWALDGSIDKPEPVAITAKAVDNEGGDSTTAAVSITIYSRQMPGVTITSPAEGTVYCSNLAGVITEVTPTIEFETEDIDGTIDTINIYVDGELAASPDVPAVSYKLTESLTAGDHTIIVEVYDNDGQRQTDSVAVVVEDQGKTGFILNENYAAEDLLAKWNKSGDADFANGSLTDYAGISGVIISGAAGTANHAITRNLSDTSFTVDVKVAFNDTATKRTVKLGSATLVTFNADGTYDGTDVTGRTYLAGEVYNISAVVDAANGKVYSLVNGEQIGSAAATYTVNSKIIVAQEGTGETAIISASASLIGSAVEPAVYVSGSTLVVEFEAGVDVSTLDGNVSMVDTITGEAVSLIYADGAFTINEVLKYDTAYEISVLPDARDINGAGFSGTYKYAYVTAEPASVGVAAIVADGVSLVDGTYSATLTVDFNGADKVGKTVYLVYAAFDGSKMVSYDKAEITVSNETATSSIELTGVGADTAIEVFVVDDMENLNAVSDRIFVIK